MPGELIEVLAVGLQFLYLAGCILVIIMLGGEFGKRVESFGISPEAYSDSFVLLFFLQNLGGGQGVGEKLERGAKERVAFIHLLAGRNMAFVCPL